MPEKDEFLIGHKFPFNSCEILCSDNGLNISKLIKMPLGRILKEKINCENKNETKEIDKEQSEENNEIKKVETINETKNEENIEESKNIENKNENSLNEKSNKENNKEKEENNANTNESNNSLNEKGKDKKEETQEENKDKIEEENNKEEKERKEENKESEKKEDNKEEKNVDKNEEKQEDKNDNKSFEDGKKEEKEEEGEEHLDDFVASINDIEEEKEDLEKENEEEMIDEKENERIINEEILNHLFSFIDNKSSVENSVISSYFTKITNFLLKKNTKLILEYFFIKNENTFNKFLSNIGQPSIANVIENILNALFDNIIPDTDIYFNKILSFILNLISKEETNDETVEAIYQLLTNSIIYNNKLKFCHLIESSFIQELKDRIKKLYEDKERNSKKIMYVIVLITKMNNNILNNLENRITPNLNLDAGKVEIINIINNYDRNSYQYFSSNENKINSQNIFNVYLLNLQKYCMPLSEISLIVIEDLLNDNNLGKDKKKLGEYYIYQFEFICSVIDLFINNLNFDVEQRTFTTEIINQLEKTKIFKKINELYFIYKENNMFSNIYSQIINIIINEQSPKELIDNILLTEENNQDKNLVNLIINDIITNLKYIYEESKNEMYSLSFSHQINILNYIFSSNNIYIKEIIEKMPNSKFFYEMMVKNIMNQFNKKLYKINNNIEQKKVDLLNPCFDAQKEQSDTNIPFSLQSFNEIVSFYLLVFEKFNKNEDYEKILKENEELLEVSTFLYKYINNIEKKKRARIFRKIRKRKRKRKQRRRG